MIICLLIPLSTVSASDINTTADNQVLSATPNVDTISANVNNGENNNDTLSVQNDEKNILSAGPQSGNNILGANENGTKNGTYAELKQLIALSKYIVSLDRNYYYSGTTDSDITIDKPILINGNGFTIGGKGLTINSDNVTFNKINFENIQTTTWNGANGKITSSNITKQSTTSTIIDWYGEDGLMDDCKFLNLGSSSLKVILLKFYASNFVLQNSEFINLTTAASSINPVATAINFKMRNCNMTNINVSSSEYQAFLRIDNTFTMENCHIKNVDSGSSGPFIFSAYPKITFKNCEFDHMKGYVFNSEAVGTHFEYCNFTNVANPFGNGKSTSASVSSDVVFDHCNFENSTNGSAIYVYGNGVIINNTVFKNVIDGVYQESGFKFLTVENCEFYNINPSLGAITLQGNYTTIKNCTFNTESDKPDIYVNGNYSVNVDTLTIDSGANITGTNPPIQGFTSYPTVHVSPNGAGDGSEGSPCSLATAINLVDYGGTIIMHEGIYNNFTTSTVITCNVKGEGNVILNKGMFRLQASGLTVENIIFNQTTNSFETYDYCTLKNCQFNNSKINNNNYLIRSYNDVYSKNMQVVNLSCENTNFTYFTGFFKSNIGSKCWPMGYNLDQLTFKNCYFTSLINCAICVNCNLTNVKIYGGNFTQLLTFATESLIFGSKSVKDFNVEHILLKDVTFTNLMDVYMTNVLSASSKSVVINDLTINSCTQDNAELMSFSKNVLCSNVKINNLNNPSNKTIIKVTGQYNTIRDIELDTLNATNIIDFGNQNVGVENISLNNANVSSVFTSIAAGMSLKGLNLTNVNCTSGNILLLSNNNVVIRDSNFEDYSGHIYVDADNIQIFDSNFTRGNNTGLNGSSIYLNKGSDFFKAIGVKFTSNNAHDGNGTVYISIDCSRPQLNDCNFTNNTAKNGGAIYVVSNATKKAIIAINDNTNSTIYYPDQSQWVRDGYNDFYGIIDDTFDVLYIINDTDANGNGRERLSPTNDLTKLYALNDGAVVYFVRENDTFTPVTPNFNYGSDFNDITFYGNNTTLLDMGFTITGNNIKVYNITFKDYHNQSAIVINGYNALFDNCSFVDVGGESIVNGGAMQINNFSTITNSKFINCIAGNVSKDGSPLGVGGALYINASNTHVENCTFIDNSVTNAGSSIYINNDLDSVILKGNNFTFGIMTSSGDGSAVYIDGGSNLVIENNQFINNTAITGGGLTIVNDILYAKVSGNNFTNNTAINGGGLYLKFTNRLGGWNNITDNDFFNNTATLDGGALYIDTCTLSMLSMNGNYYYNNTAENGGAVYINCPDFELVDVTVENNTATNGGGVYVNAAGVTIRDVDFIGNNATVGGALYVNALNTNVVDSNFIANNATTVDSYGSAVYVSKDGGITLTNVELNKNHVFGENSTFQRGDIYVDNGRFADKGITYGNDPYKQYLSNISIYHLTIAYVSEIGGGSGTAYNDPATLSKVLKVLDSNSIIYIVGDNDLTYDMFTLSNLTNVTIVNFNDGRNRKIKQSEDAKYLFILPNT